MPILSHPAFGPRASLVYITVGTLLDVWVGVWYFAFARNGDHPLTSTTQFWLLGLFLTGLTLVIIGLLLGQIGRAARKAELPPPEALAAEARIQQNAAANPNGVVAAAVAPTMPTAPGMPVAPVAPAMPAQPAPPPGMAPAVAR
jgi:type VI protein secretion system component VasK